MNMHSRLALRTVDRRAGSGRPAVSIAAAIALAMVTAASAAHATNYTITVDASNQTAGNPRFWAASVGTGTATLTLRSDLQTHYKLGNRELGMLRVRGHGVLSDKMGIYKGPGSYDWTSFDKYLDGIVSAGMRPIMELSFMPTALALNGSQNDFPKDINVYKQFIQAVVQHCVDKYTAADVGQWYWEVWNEPDYPGFWNGKNATESTDQKMADYYLLYDAAVDAITAVLPNALVGGPGSTYSGPIAGFLQHCRSANKRVTFASSHAYPGGNANSTSASATSLVSDNDSRISQITGAGYTTAMVKSVNTEWNSSYNGQGGAVGDAVTSMDNNWNAAFILKGVKLLSDKDSGDTPPLDVFSYWVLSDVFDESGGGAIDSYIDKQGGTLPFGRVFGLMTFQGMRKAPFNAFKMLNYLGPKRLKSAGGVGGDGVDAMATLSAAGDELQILVYDTFATLNSSGADMVTVNVSNLPAALSGQPAFVTHFRVDDTHSNPYGIWVGQGSPTNPSEAQWQAMRAAQHLALLQPVSKTTLTTSFTTSFSIPHQAGSLIIVGIKRPVTGRSGLVEIEGEDYDGQSGATKEDSNDTGVGQSISVTSGGSIFYDNVDFSDGGVNAVQLRVLVAADTTIELHADSATGPQLGKCSLNATGGHWATQMCTLAQTTGVHNLYALSAGAVHLNWMKFQQAAGGTGNGGRGGSGGGTGGMGGSGSGTAGTSGAAGGGATGGAAGGTSAGAGGSTSTGTAGIGIGGDTGAGGAPAGSGGAGGTTSVGAGGVTGAGGSGNAGASGSGGSAPAAGGNSGCGCGVGFGSAPSGTVLVVGLVAAAVGLRRRRPGRTA